jgi:hypothetical protein
MKTHLQKNCSLQALKFLFLNLVFVIISNPAFSQTEISGVVSDAETGEKLPSATILLQESYRGTITNTDGFFTLTADDLPATLLVRYIGYESKLVEVTGQSELPAEIRLNLSVTEMDEIEVTGRDPGLSIMEYVIERKKLWRRTLKTYKVDAYTRQSLSNDTSIVSITESSSVAFWDHERGHREVQLTRRQTSNLSDDQNFAGVRYQPNFYDDNIEIAGYNMVGITHPNALRYYHFRLLDTEQMDGIPVYKIEVTPRRTRQPLFEGTAWVLGREYALLEVDLKPNDVVSFPPPVQDFDLSYKQQFSNYGGEYWLPVDMRVDGLVRIGMVGLQFPPIGFRQVSRLSDYEINTELPDSVYSQSTWLVRADSSTANEHREKMEAIPLTQDEILAYERIDSTATLQEAFKPEGLLARMAESSGDREGGGLFFGTSGVIPGGVSLRGRFNRMDGFHLGLNFDRRFHHGKLQLKGFSGYSFHSKLWDYGGSVNQQLFELYNSTVYVFAGYEHGTSPRYASGLYTMGMNSVVTLLGGDDYFDYYRNERLHAGFEIQRVLPGVAVSLNGKREYHEGFEAGSEYDYSLFNWHDQRRFNPEISEGTLQSIGAELGYNVTQNDFGLAGKRQIKLGAEFSNAALGSDFDFTRLSFRLDWNFSTFYPRRFFANTLDLHISGGTAIGDLPLQRFGAADGSMNRFTPFGSLKTRNGVPYEGNRYWTAAAEHNFRTIPFELLGLRPLVDRGWGIILFGGAGYAEANGKYPANLMVSDGIHSEIGISLNSILGIVRIDIAKRLDAPGAFIGLSVPRYF